MPLRSLSLGRRTLICRCPPFATARYNTLMLTYEMFVPFCNRYNEETRPNDSWTPSRRYSRPSSWNDTSRCHLIAILPSLRTSLLWSLNCRAAHSITQISDAIYWFFIHPSKLVKSRVDWVNHILRTLTCFPLCFVDKYPLYSVRLSWTSYTWAIPEVSVVFTSAPELLYSTQVVYRAYLGEYQVSLVHAHYF